MSFIVVAASVVYTGKAGVAAWSANRADAFVYEGEGEATTRAANLNRMTLLHGHTFRVERQ